jgi:Flp pilus assembly CpaE family ATPase
MPRFRALVGCSGAILVMPHNRSQAFINVNERLLALTNVYARLKFAGRMIGICSHEGGVGKTTTAVHFAAIMASQRQDGV